ncbi:MAG: fibronectin type III-like domain-contianing protein, partial [Flavisolibacter sp.]
FKKIWLDPGQSQTVTFTITPELLSFYNKDMKWVVEPGDFTIMVGTSSEKTTDIKIRVSE